MPAVEFAQCRMGDHIGRWTCWIYANWLSLFTKGMTHVIASAELSAGLLSGGAHGEYLQLVSPVYEKLPLHHRYQVGTVIKSSEKFVTHM